MTDREAIALMESDLPYFCDDEDDMTKQTYLLAISALQERIDREKGCEYCNGNVDERPFLDSKDLYISEGGWLTLSDEEHDFCKIEFCPKCGRRLKTAMPGEEEQHD